jgi:uncharacterized membrane protein YjjP (DUF1212 family)
MESKKKEIQFVMLLGQALHRYGTNAFRLEAALKKVCSSLSLGGQFFSTPTALMASFSDSDDEITKLQRLEPGRTNIEKLIKVDKVANCVMSGQTELSQGTKDLHGVLAETHLYGNLVTLASFALSSFAISLLFSGTWTEAMGAALGGLSVGLWALLGGMSDSYKGLFEVLAAASAAFISAVIAWIFPGVNFEIMLVASVVILLPGLDMTIALSELATKHLASGTARMLGAFMDLLKIGFGSLVGMQMAIGIFGVSPFSAWPTTAQMQIGNISVGMIAACLALMIQYRSPLRYYGWTLSAACIGFFATRYVGASFDPLLAPFIGALLIGSYSNGFARFFSLPAATLSLPGIIFLVPGSIGMKSFGQLANHNYVTGLELAFQALLIGIGLAAGLFVGNLLVNPRTEI